MIRLNRIEGIRIKDSGSSPQARHGRQAIRCGGRIKVLRHIGTKEGAGNYRIKGNKSKIQSSISSGGSPKSKIFIRETK